MILWLALSCMFALWCHNASEEETSCADAAGSTCLPDTRDKTWEQKKCEQKRFRFNCITVARPHTHTHTHTHSLLYIGWMTSVSSWCSGDLRNIYLYLDCFQSELDDVELLLFRLVQSQPLYFTMFCLYDIYTQSGGSSALWGST